MITSFTDMLASKMPTWTFTLLHLALAYSMTGLARSKMYEWYVNDSILSVKHLRRHCPKLCMRAGCVSLSASLTEMTAARSCWSGAHEWLLPMADLLTPSDVDA